MKYKLMCLMVVSTPLLASLGGCVTNSPDDLFAVPETQHPGQVQDTGQFLPIGVDPVKKTQQMTAEEQVQIREELARKAEKSSQQAKGTSEQSYKKQVEALQQLAVERQKQLQQQIEGNNPTQ